MKIFKSHKQTIEEVSEKLNACLGSFLLDEEILLVSQTFTAVSTAILNFGEAELNFRKGERFQALNLSQEIINYSNANLEIFNSRGIVFLDRAISTFQDFLYSNEFSSDGVPIDSVQTEIDKVKECLSESHLKVSDVTKLYNATMEVIEIATQNGEQGVVNFILEKLNELKEVRLTPHEELRTIYQCGN